MRDFGSNTPLTGALNEAQRNVLSDYDFQYALNELATIFDRARPLEKKLIYTAEAVPVFIAKHNDSKVYMIESDVLKKFMECQHIDVSCALNQIKEALLDDPAISDITIPDMAVVFKKEDVEEIERVCKEDPSAMVVRCESVNLHVSFIDQIMSEGAQIFFKH